jgi:hypothetical protein
MRWFRVIHSDNAVADPLVTQAHDLPVDASMLRQGRRIESWTGRAVLKVVQPDHDGEPDDALQNHLNLLVASKRLREALESARIRGIQFLPVDVARSSNEVLTGFSLVNITELRPALYRDLSDFSVFPADYFLAERRGNIRAIRRATLLSAGVQGTDMLRLEEYRASEYVSERFVDAFVGGQFSGLGFVPIDVR